jgi:hypothetical protein
MIDLYILLTGIGIGSFLGFCLKMLCCREDRVYTDEYNSDENGNNSINTDDSDIGSDHNIVNDTQGYIQYLESMLNNSTDVTTSSFSLQPVDVSFNNITSDSIFVVPHSPTQMMPPRMLTPRPSPRRTPPKPSAPPSDIIYLQDEDILGDITYTYVEEYDRV